ncbi:MAG: bifunctional DNA-formamidopyrimidine glycosylase/DNA-(apurinic or apyrimidinic site) lyase [Candidatus Nealsonbacteria bacterium]|nr:bifunctional DNA-formamidopyrimidine glycosylase/DNA-(apurinic or apyrimidinic site) lyase [Candidatus Nealsonbacteria bacterium]
MPELPEVETIVRGLRKKVLGRTFLDVWTDNPKTVKRPKTFDLFRKAIKGERVKKIGRRGKNILIYLLGGKVLLIHQKMTGHLLYGLWRFEKRVWRPAERGPLEDPANRFIHLLFWLDNKKMLALSDLRKFAKVELWGSKELEEDEDLKKIGPEPLARAFTYSKFKEVLKKRRGKIKQVLMDQEVLAGIGNIYSDEILWEAKVHPLAETSRLPETSLNRIYEAVSAVLKKAIAFRGDSMSDYRQVSGEKGRYQEIQRVYRQEGKPCPRNDGGIIERLKIGGRSGHFCPVCQK